MPITQSAIKAHRQSIKKNAENNIVKKRLRATVKEFVGYLSTDVEKAKEFIPNVYKAIDKTTKRGILKKNSAARKKSRLMAKLNQASAEK
ncbi:MAG: 30S ribosomal protein S20 [Minisyncoccia bacterium]